ncbi:MAG: cupin domain-containing protein [Natronomonas sp.]
MGYRVVNPEAVEPEPDRPCECRRLSAPAELETMAINQFRAEPGETLPLKYHYHDTQQEAFYVIEGLLGVETPEESYEVPAGSLFVVDPESPQRTYNPETNDETTTVLAIGAPQAEDVHAYDPDG